MPLKLKSVKLIVQSKWITKHHTATGHPCEYRCNNANKSSYSLAFCLSFESICVYRNILDLSLLKFKSSEESDVTSNNLLNVLP